MRQIINREDFFDNINGRFIVQLSFGEDENLDISKTNNSGFWLEKRISFISFMSDDLFSDKFKSKLSKEDKGGFVILNGLYYNNSPKTMTEFLHHFNGTKIGDEGFVESADRFCRLLTGKELDWLNLQMKLRNQ